MDERDALLCQARAAPRRERSPQRKAEREREREREIRGEGGRDTHKRESGREGTAPKGALSGTSFCPVTAAKLTPELRDYAEAERKIDTSFMSTFSHTSGSGGEVRGAA